MRGQSIRDDTGQGSALFAADDGTGQGMGVHCLLRMRVQGREWECTVC